MENLSLFGPEDVPAGPEMAELPLAARLRDRLTRLREDGIWMGASSWKYEGWLDRVYSRERYRVRGRFSRAKFEQECLAEYGEVFPIVCGDFSFYQFPAPEFWRKLFGLAPPALRFALKVPEEVTVRVWPRHERYGTRGGTANDSFLDPEILRIGFLDPLAPYRERIAALIFEFTPMRSVEGFLDQLSRFLAALPDHTRYAVEIRNPELLGGDYFSLLRSFRTAHVLNAWTRMPELRAQLGLPGVFSADFTLVRALLRQGRPYERAVEQFSPYSEVQDPNPEARAAIVDLANRARQVRQPSYIFINNRFEGHAPGTMDAIAGALDEDAGGIVS
jgi:uncharacterized protein YecE (DUF72 family)